MKATLQRALWRTLPVLAAVAAACGSVGAAVLYQQSPVDDGLALLANYSVSGGFGTQNADSFSLGSATRIERIQWWGTAPSGNGSFVVRLFPELLGGGDIFDVLTGGVTDAATGLTDDSGASIRLFELTLDTPIDLPAGTRHLSVFFDSVDTWAWLEGSGGDDVSAFRGMDLDRWQFLPPDLSFALLGERIPQGAPEPGVLALVAVASLAGLGIRRRRSNPAPLGG